MALLVRAMGRKRIGGFQARSSGATTRNAFRSRPRTTSVLNVSVRYGPYLVPLKPRSRVPSPDIPIPAFTMERELASAEPFSCLMHAGTHHGTEASGGGSVARRTRKRPGELDGDGEGAARDGEKETGGGWEREGRRGRGNAERRNRAVERAREKESYPDTHPRGSTRTRSRAHGRRTRTDAAVARKKSGDGDREGGWLECQERTQRGIEGEQHERARRRTVRT